MAKVIQQLGAGYFEEVENLYFVIAYCQKNKHDGNGHTKNRQHDERFKKILAIGNKSKDERNE